MSPLQARTLLALRNREEWVRASFNQTIKLQVSRIRVWAVHATVFRFFHDPEGAPDSEGSSSTLFAFLPVWETTATPPPKVAGERGRDRQSEKA